MQPGPMRYVVFLPSLVVSPAAKQILRDYNKDNFGFSAPSTGCDQKFVELADLHMHARMHTNMDRTCIARVSMLKATRLLWRVRVGVRPKGSLIHGSDR
jgi:hypothetical protein